MADRRPDVGVDARGGLRTLHDDAAARLAPRVGGYHVVVDAPGLLVLRGERPGGDDRVLMAGEIVSRLTVVEVVNVLASTRWRGVLVVAPEAGPGRALRFDQGALKAAESEAPGDRLGEVLYRTGRLDLRAARTLLAECADDRALAARCLAEGRVDQEGLFAALRRQAEEIFHAALLVADGAYVFRAGGAAEEPARAPLLHLSVQGLLMEGVQRIDEMALFRERVPSLDLVPEPRPGPPLTGSQEPLLTRVLTVVDGRRTLREVARLTGLGDFAVTKAAYQLLQQGALALRSGPRADPATARRLVRQVNDVMRDVFVAVATYGGIDQTRAAVAAWIEGSGHAALLGPEVDVDGSIDAAVVLEGLARLDDDHPLERLHQALHELAAFALFAATTSLPRDQELRLARDVERRLHALRL